MHTYEKFIRYAMETCDTFRLIMEPEILEHLYPCDVLHYQTIVQKLRPYLCRKLHLVEDWAPETGSAYHEAFVCFYRCCPETMGILLSKESVFDWCRYQNVPEELCFYRAAKPWYCCIAHEGEDWLTNLTEEDHAFFEKAQIPIIPGNDHEWYICWED